MLSCNTVKSSSSLIGDDSSIDLQAISFLILLNVFLLLQLLKSPSDDLGAGMIMMFGSTSSSLESSVEMGEKSDSSARSKIDLAGE